MKPFWHFFHGKFYDYRNTREYKNGVRTVLSIQFEKPCGMLLSPDEVWHCPTVTFHIWCGWIMFNGWFPWGRITKSGWGPVDRTAENLTEWDIEP